MRITISTYALVLVAATGCQPDLASTTLPLEPTLSAPNSSCAGTPTSRGAALREAVESAEDGATITLGPCEYLVGDSLRAGFDHRDSLWYNSGIRIEGKQNLTIVGAGVGRTVVRLERSVYMGFEIRSHTVGLTIRDLTIAGGIEGSLCDETPELPCYTGPASPTPRTHGIGSQDRTRGVRDLLLERLEIRDVAVGISVGGGQCWEPFHGTIRDNHIQDARGTYAGSGYGIQLGCANGVVVRDNTIIRAERHAIYQAWTGHPNSYPVVIIGNTIIDHGHGEVWGEIMSALVVARSDNVAVIDNTLIGGHAYGISGEYDPETGVDCTRCMIFGNKFVNDGALYDIWINAHTPVWTWGNTRSLNGPARVRDDSGAETPVDSEGMFWEGTQAVSAMFDPALGTDLLYVMQNDVLHAVRPDYGVSPAEGWREYRRSTSDWLNFFGMTADDGNLYVWQNDVLYAITPAWSNGGWSQRNSAGWSRPTAIASSRDGYLYMVQNGALHRVDPDGWSHAHGPPQWEGTTALGLGDGSIYLVRGAEVYELADVASATATPLR